MPKTTATEIGGIVRGALARHRVTQAKAGEVIGLSQVAISARLAGTVEFRISELQSLAQYLDEPLASLLPVDVAA